MSWNGLFAPTKTPPEAIQVINRELRVVLGEPEITRRLVDLGVEPRPSTPEELGSRMRSEIVK